MHKGASELLTSAILQQTQAAIMIIVVIKVSQVIRSAGTAAYGRSAAQKLHCIFISMWASAGLVSCSHSCWLQALPMMGSR